MVKFKVREHGNEVIWHRLQFLSNIQAPSVEPGSEGYAVGARHASALWPQVSGPR